MGGIIIAPRNGDGGGATYPPVFSSPEVGSMVVQVGPVVLVATTTDAGRHWGLGTSPRGGAAVVGRRLPTWLPGPRLGPDLGGRGGPRTVHDHRRRALLESVVFAHGPYYLQLDFLGPRVGWAYAGDVYGVWDARMVPLWRTTDGGRHWSTYSLGAP